MSGLDWSGMKNGSLQAGFLQRSLSGEGVTMSEAGRPLFLVPCRLTLPLVHPLPLPPGMLLHLHKLWFCLKFHRNLLNEYFNGRINLQVNYTPNFVLFSFAGFIFVDDLLKLRQFQRYSEDDIKRVVADNDKKRFALRNDPETDRLQVRANQGHTMEVGILVNPHGTDMTGARKFVIREPLSIHRC